MNRNRNIDRGMDMGTANMITGVPDRVGLPIEAIKEVGTALTERYWKNKQSFLQLNTVLKNMPTIADEVDKPKLAEKSKYIDDTFQNIVSNDNFHNATDAVMEVSQNLATDEFIKSLSSNYATVQKAKEDYEKRMNEKGNEALRIYKDDYERLIKEQYIKQGGSINAEGKAQRIRVFAPTTNLNLDDERQAIEDMVVKIPAKIQEAFGNVETISAYELSLIDDPELRNVLSMMPISETKQSISVRDIPTIREAVTNYLSMDADFKTKIQELTFINHYKAKDRTDVLPEDLISLINTKGSVPSSVLIGVSPLFNSSVEALKSKYAAGLESNNISVKNKAILNYNKEFMALHDNEAIKQDAVKEVTSMENKDITKIYFDSIQGAMMDDVLSSGDKYEISESRLSKSRFNTSAFLDAFLKQKENIEDTRIAMYDNMSLNLPIESLITTPGSVANKEFISVKSTYNDMIQSLNNPSTSNKYTEQEQANITAKWQHLKSVYDSTQKNIYLNYSNLEESDKKDIRHTVKNILTKHYYANTPTSTTREQFSISPSSRLSENDRNISFGIVSSISEDDLISLSPVELLQKNIAHAKAYNQLSNEGKKEIMSVIRKAQGEASKKIVRFAESKGTITVPVTYTSMLNNKTSTYYALTHAVTSALAQGTLVDALTNTNIPHDKLGKHINQPLKNITVDDLDMTKAEIELVNSNNSLPPGNYLQLKVPIRGEDTNGQYRKDSPQQYRTMLVRFDNNPELYNSLLIETANIASRSLNSPIAHNESVTTIINQVKTLGGKQMVHIAPNKQALQSVGTITNSLKLEPGKYNKDIYLPSGTENEYYKMIVSRENANSPVKILMLNPNGTTAKGFSHTGNVLYNIDDLSALIGIHASWGFNEAVRATTLNTIMKFDK